jgi:hypothetical protein
MNLLTGGLMIAAGYGAEFETPDDASSAIDFLAELLVETYLEDVDGTPGNPVEASIGRLGEERLGQATMIRLDEDEFFEEVVLGITLVRKQRFLQILMGGSSMGPLSQLAQISSDIDSRWPSDDLWSIVPELADMPTGMVLESEEEYSNSDPVRDVEPASDDGSFGASALKDVGLEEDSLTFSVELRVSGLYLEADRTTDTCSGAGFYDVVDAGSELTILDGNTDELLYSAILSQGVLKQSSCVWTTAILGLPPRFEYEFFVGQKRMGTAKFEDIQLGETIRFEKGK